MLFSMPNYREIVYLHTGSLSYSPLSEFVPHLPRTDRPTNKQDKQTVKQGAEREAADPLHQKQKQYNIFGSGRVKIHRGIAVKRTRSVCICDLHLPLVLAYEMVY